MCCFLRRNYPLLRSAPTYISFGVHKRTCWSVWTVDYYLLVMDAWKRLSGRRQGNLGSFHSLCLRSFIILDQYSILLSTFSFYFCSSAHRLYETYASYRACSDLSFSASPVLLVRCTFLVKWEALIISPHWYNITSLSATCVVRLTIGM